MFLDVHWLEPSFAHDNHDSIGGNLDEISHRRIQIINQQGLVKMFPETVEVKPNGQVLYRRRVKLATSLRFYLAL